MRQRPRLLTGVVIALSALVLPVPALARAPSEAAQVQTQLAGVRLPFIANQGQVDARVAYYAPTFAGTLLRYPAGEPVYALSGPQTDAPRDRGRPSVNPGWSLTETLRGGRARPVAQDRSTTGVSTFLGNDPARWRAALPTWEQVSLGEVWPGVTVALRAQGRSMEKVFTVHPGGAVARIRVRVAGAHALSVDVARGAGGAHGTRGRHVHRAGRLSRARRRAPAGRRRVSPSRVRVRLQRGRLRSETLPLVIDPLLQSTYPGGSSRDVAFALAIHPATGDVYVAGFTVSRAFPGTHGGAQPALGGGVSDAFVARFPSSPDLAHPGHLPRGQQSRVGARPRDLLRDG